jgi:hypothetical protein
LGENCHGAKIDNNNNMTTINDTKNNNKPRIKKISDRLDQSEPAEGCVARYGRTRRLGKVMIDSNQKNCGGYNDPKRTEGCVARYGRTRRLGSHDRLEPRKDCGGVITETHR